MSPCSTAGSGLSNEPSSKVLRRPSLPQNGDKVPIFVVFWTISTIKDEKCAEKFHYIKTLSGKVVVQSIAFRVVSIYWLGVAPFPWYLNVKGPTRLALEAPALHTLRLIARQPWRYCVTSLRSAHWLANGLKLAARCPVSGCWLSCKISQHLTKLQARKLIASHALTVSGHCPAERWRTRQMSWVRQERAVVNCCCIDFDLA